MVAVLGVRGVEDARRQGVQTPAEREAHARRGVEDGVAPRRLLEFADPILSIRHLGLRPDVPRRRLVLDGHVSLERGNEGQGAIGPLESAPHRRGDRLQREPPPGVHLNAGLESAEHGVVAPELIDGEQHAAQAARVLAVGVVLDVVVEAGHLGPQPVGLEADEDVEPAPDLALKGRVAYFEDVGRQVRPLRVEFGDVGRAERPDDAGAEHQPRAGIVEDAQRPGQGVEPAFADFADVRDAVLPRIGQGPVVAEPGLDLDGAQVDLLQQVQGRLEPTRVRRVQGSPVSEVLP